jgi:hypothetical protein
MTSMQFDTIVVNSKNRASGDKSKFEYILQLPTNSANYRLKFSQFKNTFYTLRNDIVIFNDGAAVPITLNGNFTPASLAAKIDSLLPGTYVITYDPDLQRLVFTNNAPFTITFPSLYVARVFGFPGQLIVSTGAGLSITATDPPEVTRYNDIFIQINELGSSGSDNKSSYTYIVPIVKDRDEFVYYHEFHFGQNDYSSHMNNIQKNLHIIVYGDDGIIIPSTELTEWSFIFSTKIAQVI